MKYTLEEQETTILWDRANPEAIVYTYEPSLKRKLAELEHILPDKVMKINEEDGSVEYRIPKELVSIRRPRVLSDEARERMKENGSRLAKKGKPEEDATQLSILQA